MARKTTETNPFVQGLEIKGLWRSEWTAKGAANSEGVTAGQMQVLLIDADPQFTIFTGAFLDQFQALSTSAKDMLMWIGSHLQHNQDYLEMKEMKYSEEMGVSRNTFFAAKAQLVNRFIIPRVDRKDTYWINPMYLFRGNRVKVFRDNVVAVNENPADKMRKDTDNTPTNE